MPNHVILLQSHTAAPSTFSGRSFRGPVWSCWLIENHLTLLVCVHRATGHLRYFQFQSLGIGRMQDECILHSLAKNTNSWCLTMSNERISIFRCSTDSARAWKRSSSRPMSCLGASMLSREASSDNNFEYKILLSNAASSYIGIFILLINMWFRWQSSWIMTFPWTSTGGPTARPTCTGSAEQAALASMDLPSTWDVFSTEPIDF